MAKEYYERTNPKTTTAVIEGRAVGRDKKVIVPEQVQGLAEIGCKDKEIADFFGVSENTLRYNFSVELMLGREQMKQSLRRAMLHNALIRNNPALQIFLAKNWLGMSDNPTASQDVAPLPWSDDQEPERPKPLTEEQKALLQERLDDYNREQLDRESTATHGPE